MMRFRALLPVAVLLPTLSAAQIAEVISYQGRLLRPSDATPISEIVDIGFALYAQQEGPRQRIGSAPYALLASNLVKGGVVDAASVSAGGASGAPQHALST